MWKITLSTILLFIVFPVLAQKDIDTIQQLNLLRSKVVEGDTVPHISLHEVKVPAPWKFKNKRQRIRYSKLVRNVKKTLPYARLAHYRIQQLELALDTVEGDKAKKEFIRASEKALFDEFEVPLKKLTFSQGRMLIKLIDRETGETSYQLIKDLKGGFSAFMWQSVARLFGSNLKSEYEQDGDDAMIEHIVMLIDNGVL